MDTIAYLIAFAISLHLDSQGIPTRINTLSADGRNDYSIVANGGKGFRRHITVSASSEGVAKVTVTGPKGGSKGCFLIKFGDNPVPAPLRHLVTSA